VKEAFSSSSVVLVVVLNPESQLRGRGEDEDNTENGPHSITPRHEDTVKISLVITGSATLQKHGPRPLGRSPGASHNIPNAMQFYVTRGGQQLGPFTPDQLRSHILSGTFQVTDLAWHEGAADWAPLNSYPAIVGPSQSSGAAPRSTPGGRPPESSGLAVASLVLGILSFFTGGLTSIPAIICGHISLSHIKKAAGRMSGNGLAIGGLVTGYLGLIMIAALALGIALPVFAAVKEKAQETKCLSEAKQLALGCKLYASDHDGNYPPTLNQLFPEYLTDKKLLECPLTKDQPPMGYDYFGGKDTDPSAKVLLSSKATTRTHKRIVVTSDGAAALKREY